mmetsp:Transcript_39747/g.105257  ORF Transcript_39747/g.105257 Transcript_39747/m.105257 type:complete len:268 (+) Transcript_39747:66-869(+)
MHRHQSAITLYLESLTIRAPRGSHLRALRQVLIVSDCLPTLGAQLRTPSLFTRRSRAPLVLLIWAIFIRATSLPRSDHLVTVLFPFLTALRIVAFLPTCVIASAPLVVLLPTVFDPLVLSFVVLLPVISATTTSSLAFAFALSPSTRAASPWLLHERRVSLLENRIENIKFRITFLRAFLFYLCRIRNGRRCTYSRANALCHPSRHRGTTPSPCRPSHRRWCFPFRLFLRTVVLLPLFAFVLLFRVFFILSSSIVTILVLVKMAFAL